MSEWWSSLDFEQQVYWAVAILASTLLVTQTLLLLIGGDELADAGDADMDGPEDHPSGIHLLSSRTIVAFLFGLGWTGVIVSGQPLAQPPTTALAAVVLGLLFGAAIFWLMRLLHTLSHSGTLDYGNAIGEVGTVYLPIPAAMAASGKIQVVVQGRLKVIQALTRHGQKIQNRARVRVVELVDDNTLLVEPLAHAAPTQED